MRAEGPPDQSVPSSIRPAAGPGAVPAAAVPWRQTATLPALAAGATGAVLLYAEAFTWAGAPATTLPLFLAVFVASALSGVVGFAFSAICGAMLLHLPINHVAAVQTMMVCSVFNQCLSLSVLRRCIEWRRLPPFLLGGLAGLPLGLALLLLAPRESYAMAAGALFCGYGLFMLRRRPLPVPPDSPTLELLVGVAGGITGGVAALPSAPVTAWCQARGWGRERQRGVFQPFIFVMQILALALMALGPFATAQANLSITLLAAVPPAMAGTLIGLHCFRHLDDSQYRLLVNLLMIASGAALLL